VSIWVAEARRGRPTPCQPRRAFAKAKCRASQAGLYILRSARIIWRHPLSLPPTMPTCLYVYCLYLRSCATMLEPRPQALCRLSVDTRRGSERTFSRCPSLSVNAAPPSGEDATTASLPFSRTAYRTARAVTPMLL